MEITQKALYNSLRMSYLQDPSIAIEPWKVEDLRQSDLDTFFTRLKEYEVFLDKVIFKTYSDQFDSPEELTEWLFDHDEVVPEVFDQVYLLVFELWRRLLPEKPSISIVCDELDYQIFTYDQGHLIKDTLQDALGNLHKILEENVDQGMCHEEVFAAISEFCAHDIEHFLYDYIAELIATKEYRDASTLVDDYYSFVIDKRWFDLLRARLFNLDDLEMSRQLVEEVFQNNRIQPLIELDFEILICLVQSGDYTLFIQVVHQILELIEAEDEFIELLTICADFFRCSDKEELETKLESMIQRRKQEVISTEFESSDPDLTEFQQLLVAQN